jgi:hypothetical protein
MMVRKYRGSEVPRPFNPGHNQAHDRGPDAGDARGQRTARVCCAMRAFLATEAALQRASSVGGMVRPSILAVWALMISSSGSDRERAVLRVIRPTR